ncbi:hypothetical protein [Microbacterium indicum]|uniref:hypothetical protein n=1 Tax=Microbacterium indicum TaxID=358100 RepID=UPI00040E15DC|nr:hypothetical protein [Microbacterium indicum]
MQKHPEGVAPGSPVPTPFSDITSAEAAARFWKQAGAATAEPVDLSWASAARMSHWTARQRLLRRDRYFAVTADAV